MRGHGAKFARKREQAIIALLTHRSIEDAARAVGINANTLLRWLKLPEFQKDYREARRIAFGQSVVRLQQASGAAVTTLLKLVGCRPPRPGRGQGSGGVLRPYSLDEGDGNRGHRGSRSYRSRGDENGQPASKTRSSEQPLRGTPWVMRRQMLNRILALERSLAPGIDPVDRIILQVRAAVSEEDLQSGRVRSVLPSVTREATI